MAQVLEKISIPSRFLLAGKVQYPSPTHQRTTTTEQANSSRRNVPETNMYVFEKQRVFEADLVFEVGRFALWEQFMSSALASQSRRTCFPPAPILIFDERIQV